MGASIKSTRRYCPISSGSQLPLSRANPGEQLSELHQDRDESSSPPTVGRRHSIFNLSSSLNQPQCNSCENVVKQMNQQEQINAKLRNRIELLKTYVNARQVIASSQQTINKESVMIFTDAARSIDGMVGAAVFIPSSSFAWHTSIEQNDKSRPSPRYEGGRRT